MRYLDPPLPENIQIDHLNRQVASDSVYIGIYIGRCLGALLRIPFRQVVSVVAYLRGKDL